MSIFPQGMDSGFGCGEDEIYNVYDQAWRGGKDMAQNIYRPSKNLDKDMYGDDLEARIKTNRYQGRPLSFNIYTSENKVVHSHFSSSLDLFPIRSFLVQTVDKEAEKDQFSLRRILSVWTNFWKKPSNFTVALKDPQIATVPGNTHEHEGKEKEGVDTLFRVNELLLITLMMQVIWGTLCTWPG